MKAPENNIPERHARGNYSTGSTVNAIAAFHEAMAEAGIVPECSIPPTGELTRFRVEGDKPGSRNGWAVLHVDSVSSGAFGSWKEGITHSWSAKARQDLTEAEKARQLERIQKAKAERDRIRRESQEQAATRAREIWTKARPADPKHPYLLAKGVPAFNARQYNSALVLPLVDFDRNLKSLQFIDADGSKRLLAGGRKQDFFIPVVRSENPGRVLIVEGWATGATLAADDPTATVLAAVDSGNLLPVATGARNRWPDAEIVVAGDDDRATSGNLGVKKTREAAIAAGAQVAFPRWPPGAPETLTDFNDLMLWQRGAK